MPWHLARTTCPSPNSPCNARSVYTSGQVNWFAVVGNREFYCTINAVTNDASIIIHVEIKGKLGILLPEQHKTLNRHGGAASMTALK